MSYRHQLEELWKSDNAAQVTAKSRKASISFTLGLLSFLVSILAGVPAIINGLLGLREIRQSGGRLQGKRMAISGIVLGLMGSMISGSLVAYAFVAAHQASQRISTL
jgi:hypothetical protein